MRTYKGKNLINFSSVQLLSHVRLFETPWTATYQAFLSITNSRSPPKPMSIESVMPSNHLILCFPFSSHPQSFPASGSFQMSQFFASGGQRIGVSASTSVLPMNTQNSSPLGWTGWISLQSKGLSRVFSSTQFKTINSSALSFLYSPTLTSIHDHWKNHSLWVVPCQMVMTFINIIIHMALQFEKELMFTWSGHWEGCLLWVIVKCQKEVFLKSTKSCNTRMWMAATLCPQFLIQRLQLSDHLQL